MTRRKITFSKFEGSGHISDDRVSTIFRGNERIGEVTAVVGNIGGYTGGEEWRIVAYEVDIWDDDGETIARRVYTVRNVRACVGSFDIYQRDPRTPARRVLSAAKAWARKRA